MENWHRLVTILFLLLQVIQLPQCISQYIYARSLQHMDCGPCAVHQFTLYGPVTDLIAVTKVAQGSAEIFN